MASVIN